MIDYIRRTYRYAEASSNFFQMSRCRENSCFFSKLFQTINKRSGPGAAPVVKSKR